ncbi:MAG TPA: formate dehydrogenase [Caldimonas sp.]|nr:formate dehydrogenase [Caldimonas sp.]
MKPTSSSRADAPAREPAPVARRRIMAGAGVAAGAAVVAHLVSRSDPAPEPAAATGTKPEEGQGYRLTAHVQRYYETTKA